MDWSIMQKCGGGGLKRVIVMNSWQFMRAPYQIRGTTHTHTQLRVWSCNDLIWSVSLLSSYLISVWTVIDSFLIHLSCFSFFPSLIRIWTAFDSLLLSYLIHFEPYLIHLSFLFDSYLICIWFVFELRLTRSWVIFLYFLPTWSVFDSYLIHLDKTVVL